MAEYTIDKIEYDGNVYKLQDNVSGYIKNYIETDPVYSASPAAGITATDISNWNAKVSDDKTWNGVTLDKSVVEMSNQSCRIPFMWDVNGETSARMIKANKVPTASQIAIYDDSAYLNSTTPSVGDNSTKVATTAYVNGKHTTATATLSTTWTSNQQSVTVSGVTTSNTVVVTPAPASYDAYCAAGIYCSAQAANSLTFKCEEAPSSSLTVNILIVN